MEIDKGSYKGEIRNNLNVDCNRFIWKATFNNVRHFDKYNSSDFYIIDCQHKKLKCEMDIDKKEKSIRIIPLEDYKRNQYYYLNIDYSSKKEKIYIAFRLCNKDFQSVKFKNYEQYNEFIKKDRESTTKNTPVNNLIQPVYEEFEIQKQRVYLSEERFKVKIWPIIIAFIAIIILPMISLGLLGIIIFIIGLMIQISILIYTPVLKVRELTRLYNIGVNLFNEGHFNQALDYFNQAARLNINCSELYYAMELSKKYFV